MVFHERPHLVVRGEDGAEHTLQILASPVEHESTQTFKLLGFRDHDLSHHVVGEPWGRPGAHLL